MNWMPAFPELVLAICGLIILVVGAFLKKTESFVPVSALTIAALVGTAFLVCGSADGVGLGHLFINDNFARFLKLLILTGGILATVVAMGYVREGGDLPFETPVLMLFSTLGAMLMASSGNLITLFVGLELSSLSIYILCAIERERLKAAEAGLKYFILGSLASGLLLYGISLVYGYAGTMEYPALTSILMASGLLPVGLVIGIVFIIVGLAFKLSAVPFHMWTPDVYQGAPTPVTAFMAGAPKFAAFALLIRIMAGPFGMLAPRWQLLLVIISALSMLFGSLAAIPQTDIKRLMAYSSIGHMGYAMMGLASASGAGIRGTLVYLSAYLVMNAGVFAGIAAMRRQGHEVTKIRDLAGLGQTNPAMALTMTVFMFSMIGVPPMAGFFGKFMVFAAAWNAGLTGLLIVGGVSALIGAYYYLRVVKVMYFDAPEGSFDRPAPSLTFVSASMGVATVLYVVGLGVITSAADAAASALIG
ncbi:MAG: NADH-quinone oxidoreductase subunit NuoN [Acetobacter sp.]|jgi:NADH-quinone oxidoreductase subunit N|nr:NADH-quinone oxidoreductase subunit NuoN [Acetobacter sp.]MCH4061944.1 NADH-quinone oxidoreductase subunit NuoN [Acetobacter sp.]MCH4089207.1 NADH-quinone oxidoreductase subunit NuoN [Acetobacter sp.]MCI1293621.1 NADH-quinone oxidoreductase subunit NuoN [Acetobacter sp.]MCI1320298.1 NADH-quinone oxidoreductase subunit NuoN [Acetobacter sp.]